MATAAPYSRPTHARSIGSGPVVVMYPPRDQEFVARTKRASTRIQQVTGPYSAPQAPKRPDPAPRRPVTMAYPDSPPPEKLERPGSFFRPRRVSSSSASSVTSSVVSGRDSFDSRFDSRLRASSLNSSMTSIESMPPLKTPGFSPLTGLSYSQYQLLNGGHGGHGGQYYNRQKPAPVPYRKKARQGELFSLLPGEVLELILSELRKLHMRPGSHTCTTCWMRDCCSVAVSARKFVKYAREALYRHICIVGAEGPQMKKRTKLSYGSRLVLLRRTLRANPQMAAIVRSLKPPALPPGVSAGEYGDLIASVVMACPNLERLVGFYPTYDHSFQRLFHALSTRTRLKEMDWVLEASPVQRRHRMRPSAGSGGSVSGQLWAPGDLQPHQSLEFLEYHLDWKNLTTLVIHCLSRATLTPVTLLEKTLRSLPSLENLHLSHFPHTSFNDASLLVLPPLKKLTLSHLPGVTTGGLSSLATRSASSSIKTLTLVHMNVESLPAIARILSNLTSLETFSLVQAYAPVMPTDEFIWLFPYLASSTVRKLHWDIPYLPTRATTADTIFAKSIGAGGFPALRILRAPNDPEGIFQALCRPRERVDIVTDRYRDGQAHYGAHMRITSSFSHGSVPSTSGSRAGSRPGSRKGSTGAMGNSPTSPLFPPDALMLPRDNSNLHQARLAAQERLEAARRFPRLFINVFDEDGALVDKYGVGGFIGTVGSKINYVLTPDAGGGTDEGGGLVSVVDMLGDSGEALILPQSRDKRDRVGYSSGGGVNGYGSGVRSSSVGPIGNKVKKEKKKSDKGGSESDAGSAETKTREGCIGRWNTFSGAVVDKKDKDRWWHQERGRWKEMVLS
ncbi:hypothetical protein B0T24DRAFT_370053 [Lasiosphaeria ovina]|uniref:Uncharacterized protein n=1 Tax=Lasiosphaeria ovina TaxID=92902 RepID=A0AAE0JYR5_9PEZI|nr:hypothetical protein B0T24DRAFT_370053 [Lasiosphaeria ovina]